MKPIMISLNQIKAHDPCILGWRKILIAKGKTEADDELYPLSDGLESNGLLDTVWAFRCLPEYSDLWRKFACWCSLQVIDKAKPYFDSDEDYQLVVEYLTTCDESLRSKAYAYASISYTTAYAITCATAVEATAYAITCVTAADATAYAAVYTAVYAAAERQKQTAKLKQILDAGEWVE